MATDAHDRMLERMRSGRGFIAALDQSGGSTPKALSLYGVDPSQYSGDAEMFDRMHEMRARIMTSPSFTGARILGAILFEMTLDREVDGMGAAEHLWERREIVPFVKVDAGLAEPNDGVRLMRPMPGLDELLTRAHAHGVFGTKMRSVIGEASATGIFAVVDQQFAIARRILERGLVPIIEPEVDIHCADKDLAEGMLLEQLAFHLAAIPASTPVMLKLTLPSTPDRYAGLVAHPSVLRVAALSGGYARAEAVTLLAQNHGVIASFSRALTEGLRADMDDATFDAALDASIEAIYEASIT